MTWYALVRENKPEDQRRQRDDLTPQEIENNRNLPILIHWDRSRLQETNGYYIVPVQPIGSLK